MGTKTQAFGSGVVGACLVLALYFLLAPGYMDYRARVKADEILRNLRPVQAEIEANAKTRSSLSGAGLGIQARPSADVTLLIRPDGVLIVLEQQYGQVLVLIPSYTQGRITWDCLASGQAKDVPTACRASGATAAHTLHSPH